MPGIPRSLPKGVACSVRGQNVAEQIVHWVRYEDKLIVELARGKAA